MPAPNTQEIERKICEALVDGALQRKWAVTVFDSEEDAIEDSSDRDAILDAMFATDEETLTFKDGQGAKVGAIYLTHGEGRTVINNHTTEPELEALVDAVMAKFG